MNKLFITLLIFTQLVAPSAIFAAENHVDVNNSITTQSTADLPVITLAAHKDGLSTNLQDVVIGKARVEEYTISGSPAQIDLKKLAEQLVTEKFGTGHFAAFDALINQESSWNPNAVNASSGACGLGQALPCSKISDHTPLGQLKWTIEYIADRYGTPTKAYQAELAQHWY